MTLPILAATAREADPRRNYRMRDFLETLGLRPAFVPDPGPLAAIEAAPAAEAPAAIEAPAGESAETACANCGRRINPCMQKPCVEGCDGWVHEGGESRHGCEDGRGFALPASPLAPPAPYGHQSIADAAAAKDELGEAEAGADGS